MDHRSAGVRGLSRDHQRVFNTSAAHYAIPPLAIYGIGLGMVAPTILAHATDEVREAYLRRMHRGDIVGCQLFSEPNAGSDLAATQTKAVRDGEGWVLDGQKVWTSTAHLADLGSIVCRSDVDVPGHKGLTAFVVDMHAPGVEVRPLRQMTGGASFNEVFFSNVFVPDTHRLGEVNGGWTVVLTSLMNERAAVGGGSGSGRRSSRALIELAHVLGRNHEAVIRQKLAAILINERVSRYNNQRAMAKIAVGQPPGPEMSISKLALTQNMQRSVALVSELLGPSLTADDGRWGTYAWSEFVLGVPGMRVAGGTDEVMRNTIAERVLGLPKEPRTTAAATR